MRRSMRVFKIIRNAGGNSSQERRPAISTVNLPPGHLNLTFCHGGGCREELAVSSQAIQSVRARRARNLAWLLAIIGFIVVVMSVHDWAG